jgi:hypothetical protein
MNGSKTPKELDHVLLDPAMNASTDSAWYEEAGPVIAEIPGILSPATPPPFAKDRVMARVRTDSVSYYIPESGDDQFANT